VTLLAFAAAERRPCNSRLISLGCRAHSSKPAATACCSRMMGRRDEGTDRQTDRQTDGQQFHRPCCACCGSSVNNCQERTTYASRMRRIFFSLGPRWTVSRTRSWCGVRREAARCLLAKNSENHHRQFVTVIVPRHDFISTL